MGRSCDRIEQAVADSRERVVFLLASWTTAITAPHARKKYKCYNILRRSSDLKDTRHFGLNLGGLLAGQLSVLCRTEIFFGFNTTGNIYWLAKQHLLKNLCFVESLCELCKNYVFWKIIIIWVRIYAGR
jgi:hypothetical protein